MADGPVKTAGYCVSGTGSGTVAWSEETGFMLLAGTEVSVFPDTEQASFIQSSGITTKPLVCTQFGGSTADVANQNLTGLTVSLYGWRSSTSAYAVASIAIYLVINGVISGTSIGGAGDMPTTAGLMNFGGPGALGGLTVSAADYANTNFGVAIVVTLASGGRLTTSPKHFIDGVQIQAHYSSGAPAVDDDWGLSFL